METATVRFYVLISSSWTELTTIAPASGRWGMSDNKPETRIANVGELHITLNNSAGLYSPDGPSALTGWKLGLPVKMDVTVDGVTRRRFRGFIDSIRLPSAPKDIRVQVTVLDWIRYAQKHPIVNPALLENATVDQAFDTILSAMTIQPTNTSIATGNYIFPTLLDTVRGGTKAFDEFAKLTYSELGRAYLRHDGTASENFVTESSNTRSGTATLKQLPVAFSASGSQLLQGGGYRLLQGGGRLKVNEYQNATFSDVHVSQDLRYGENIVNRFTGYAYPKRIDETNLNIYSTERPIKLASGESKTFRIFWTDPDGKRPISATPPTGTDTTVSLLHFEEQDGLNIPDETGKTWTIVPDLYLYGTIEPAFGNYSLYFDGSSPSALTTPHSEDWEFGNGDFTIEWWEYRFATTSGQTFLSRDGTDATPAWLIGRSNGTNLLVDISSDGATWDIANGQSMGSISINSWHHFAISRSGNNFYTFKDGTQVSTWTSSATIFSTSGLLYMGRNVSTYLGALIDEVRITKGEARYTASFTVQTEPFTLSGAIYTMNSAEDGTGSDLTPSLTASATYGTEGATITIENTTDETGWATIKMYGKGIYSDSSVETTVEDAVSIAAFDYQNVSLQQRYQQDTFGAFLEAKRVIEYNATPRTTLNKVWFYANASGANMQAFLFVDIGDLVHITIASEGIDSYFYVEGVEFQIDGSGIIKFGWVVRQAWTFYDGYTQVAVDFAGGTATDAINFGHLPSVYSDKTPDDVLVSMWVYLDALPVGAADTLFAFSSYSGGFRIYVDSSGKVGIFSRVFSSSGQWLTDSAPLSASAWFHIGVYFDTSDASFNPEVWANKISFPVTETSTPSGTAYSKDGVPIVLGNFTSYTNDYDSCMNGKLKDVRVYYPSVTGLTPLTIVTRVQNFGAGVAGNFDGMVFQCFAVRDEDAADYVDLTLTTEKVLDTYLGNIGTPNGSPIVRSV